MTYPGLAEAQAATLAAFSTLPNQPKLLAPETSDFGSVADYLPSLDPAKTDALAHQLYGVNPAAVDLDALSAMGKLVSQYGRPVFVTEMLADGFGTALLIHYATVVEGASAYLQAALTGSVSGPLTNTQALLGIDLATSRSKTRTTRCGISPVTPTQGWTRVRSDSRQRRPLGLRLALASGPRSDLGSDQHAQLRAQCAAQAPWRLVDLRGDAQRVQRRRTVCVARRAIDPGRAPHPPRVGRHRRALALSETPQRHPLF